MLSEQTYGNPLIPVAGPIHGIIEGKFMFTHLEEKQLIKFMMKRMNAELVIELPLIR